MSVHWRAQLGCASGEKDNPLGSYDPPSFVPGPDEADDLLTHCTTERLLLLFKDLLFENSLQTKFLNMVLKILYKQNSEHLWLLILKPLSS